MGKIFMTDNVPNVGVVDSRYTNIGWQKQIQEKLKLNVLNYSYIAGYKNSADALLELASKSGYTGDKIFPIVFLYRQYLELLFKNILALMQGIDEYKGHPHDLQKMWGHINEVFERKNVISIEESEIINDVVQEFHTVDPKSSNFRYFFKKGNLLTLNDDLVVDTHIMKLAIDKVDEILYGSYAII